MHARSRMHCRRREFGACEEYSQRWRDARRREGAAASPGTYWRRWRRRDDKRRMCFRGNEESGCSAIVTGRTMPTPTLLRCNNSDNSCTLYNDACEKRPTNTYTPISKIYCHHSIKATNKRHFQEVYMCFDKKVLTRIDHDDYLCLTQLHINNLLNIIIK